MCDRCQIMSRQYPVYQSAEYPGTLQLRVIMVGRFKVNKLAEIAIHH